MTARLPSPEGADAEASNMAVAQELHAIDEISSRIGVAAIMMTGAGDLLLRQPKTSDASQVLPLRIAARFARGSASGGTGSKGANPTGMENQLPASSTQSKVEGDPEKPEAGVEATLTNPTGMDKPPQLQAQSCRPCGEHVCFPD